MSSGIGKIYRRGAASAREPGSSRLKGKKEKLKAQS